ncbi:putative RNA-directed DNA polymerase from transposon BS [Trichonephila clavipes]|nr:putative RNA-directed DNA polymerase from transposon BS [Trichonephila clavipes]
MSEDEDAGIIFPSASKTLRNFCRWQQELNDPQGYYHDTAILLTRLTHHLDTNNLMPPEQFAFRYNKTYQGIPQGCVLSPTVFSLFISGMEKYVNPSQIGLFADDVVLWCRDANISKMESHLNMPLVNIQEFADNHKITFNASKFTVSLFNYFSLLLHLYIYSPELFLMKELLKCSKYPTYLGFTLDPEVNCGKLIEINDSQSDLYGLSGVYDDLKGVHVSEKIIDGVHVV